MTTKTKAALVQALEEYREALLEMAFDDLLCRVSGVPRNPLLIQKVPDTRRVVMNLATSENLVECCIAAQFINRLNP